MGVLLMPILKYVYSILTLIAISFGLYIPSYLFLTAQKNQKIELHFSNRIDQASVQFESVNNAYTLLTNNFYDNVINNDEIISIVKKANSASTPERAVLRQELYTKLLPLYKNLKTYNIHRLHFHLKNSVSFLRFHSPEKFGDSLEAARYSIDRVNRTGRSSFGFEEGPSFNGFRHVYPLFLDKKFGGTVEMAYSFNAIKAGESKLRPSYNSFIIRQDVVSNKAWKSEINYYSPSSISPLYLQDISILRDNVKESLSKEIVEQINVNIADQAISALQTEQKFILHTSLDNEIYIAMFIPIYNVGKKQVAYYIYYEKDPTITLIKKTFDLETLVALIGSIFFSLLLVLYVLSQKRALHAIKLLETTDPLTKIANRNSFNIILEKSIHLSLRYKLPLSIVFFDIDHFKKINDTFGHDAGDTVLTGISSLLNQKIRSSDTFARWGGEEFIIILPETESSNAKKLAEKFRRLIEDYKFLPNAKVTCSFGVTHLHEDDDENSLFKRVDSALSSAKKLGRNKVVNII